MTRKPADWDMQLIAKWREIGTLPSPSVLAKALETVIVYHDTYADGGEIPVERDLLEIIGRRLVGAVDWARIQNEQRARRLVAVDVQ